MAICIGIIGAFVGGLLVPLVLVSILRLFNVDDGGFYTLGLFGLTGLVLGYQLAANWADSHFRDWPWQRCRFVPCRVEGSRDKVTDAVLYSDRLELYADWVAARIFLSSKSLGGIIMAGFGDRSLGLGSRSGIRTLRIVIPLNVLSRFIVTRE
jgi:hypothetical protein